MKGYTNVLAPGTILKGKAYRYEIIKVLGQGSFGITYLASVQVSGELGSIDAYVAIKEFFMSDINGRSDRTVTASNQAGLFDNYKQKFVKEAYNLSRLNHPNIVKVLECFETNNTVYYAMDFINGDSLEDYISKRGQLNERETLCITDQILDALEHMHSKGMLHLDLKPSNIMMRQGIPILIDFGLSKQYDSNGIPETSTSIGGGTPGYSPIEQTTLYGGSQTSGMSSAMDIYAVGATMFKMLTGHRPPIASEILNSGFPNDELQRRNITMKTSDLVRRLMNPLWKQRPQNVASIRNEFHQPMDGPEYESKKDENTTVFDSNKADIQPPTLKPEHIKTPVLNPGASNHENASQYAAKHPYLMYNEGKQGDVQVKERHGCISVWLWVALVANVLLVLLYGIAMFGVDSTDEALGFGLCSVGAAVNVLSVILLLRWYKPGFYMMAICSLIAIAINIFILMMEPYVMIGTLLAVVIWWAILQIKKNGASAWSQLNSGWGGKQNQVFYWIFGGLISLLFVLTLVAYRHASENSNNYDWDDEIVEEVEAVEAIVEEESVYDKRLRFLNSMIETTNESFPQDVEEGVKMTKVFLEGDYVVYILECDEDVLDMDLLRKSKDSMKKVIKGNLSSSDPDIERELKTCINAGKGLGYRYVGDTSRKSLTIQFSVKELTDILQ